MTITNHYGTHGTSASRAADIGKLGFSMSTADAIRGTGAYFWRLNPYAHSLAIVWYIVSNKKGNYSKDKDNRCAVISVDITCDSRYTINFEDPEIKDDFLSFFAEKGIPDKFDIGDLYDEYLARLETYLAISFKLIMVAIPPPSKPQAFPRQGFGNPYCYIVKDPAAIKIKKIVIYDENEVKLCKILQQSEKLQSAYLTTYAQ